MNEDIISFCARALTPLTIMCLVAHFTTVFHLPTPSQACTPSTNTKTAMFPAFSPAKLLLENAAYFPGMTLTVSSNPASQARPRSLTNPPAVTHP